MIIPMVVPLDEQYIREKIEILDQSMVEETILFLEKAVYDYGYTYAKEFYFDYPDDAELVINRDLGVLSIYDAAGEVIGSYMYLELLDDLDESLYTDELGKLEFEQLLKDMDYEVLSEQFINGEIDAIKAKFGEDGFVRLDS